MKRVLSVPPIKKSGLLFNLLLLTVFFIFLEISVLVQGSDIYLGDYKLIADHLQIPGNVIPGIFYFIFVQISLHLFFTFSIFVVALFIGVALQSSTDKTEQIGMMLWFIGIGFILVANQHFFSQF